MRWLSIQADVILGTPRACVFVSQFVTIPLVTKSVTRKQIWSVTQPVFDTVVSKSLILGRESEGGGGILKGWAIRVALGTI